MTRLKLDLREAAEVLETSVDAVRKRIQRGTLDSEKVDGKVYVWLDDGAPRSDADALISEMRAHNETLREQLQAGRDDLQAERNAHAETRRLLAGALERIPALESPDEPESATPPRSNTHTPPGAETGAERRSWWRKFFGIG